MPFRKATDSADNQFFLTAFKQLSERELQTVELICEGLTSKEIAETLSISYRTVDIYRNRVFKKTSVKNRAQLGYLVGKNQLR